MDHDPEESHPLPVVAIVAVFVVMLLSIAGSTTPRIMAYWQRRKSGEVSIESWWIYALMNGLAGGLILGVGWIHSVTDAYSSFEHAFPEPENGAQEYAWAGFIAMMGALLAFFVDEAVHSYLFHHPHTPQRSTSSSQSEVSGDIEKSIEVEDAKVEKPEERTEFSKMLILLAGLSFHNFFVGLALGLSEGEVGLFIAIAAHQFFEGIAMGQRIMKAEKETGKRNWIYDIIFAIMCSIGIAVGIGIALSIEHDDHDDHDHDEHGDHDHDHTRSFMLRHGEDLGLGSTYSIVNGVFQALSAGILIYVALVHVVSGGHHDSPHTSNQHHTANKWATYFGVLLGAAVMAIIGIWA